MTRVIFYEKPGCSNNARQKQLLSAAGHDLDIRDLLTEAWTPELLRSYFEGKPVAAWFNKAAPKIKSGEIKPDAVDADTALAMMLAEPILIRRPLMEAAGRRNAGFDPVEVEAWIGLENSHTDPQARSTDLETCRRNPPAADHSSASSNQSALANHSASSASETNPS
jgi:nitrogenase-associated protein